MELKDVSKLNYILNFNVTRNSFKQKDGPVTIIRFYNNNLKQSELYLI